MQHQIYPDACLEDLLKLIIASSIKLHLFSNNVTIDQSTTLGGLTEASYMGYSSVTIANTDFTIYSLASHKGLLKADPHTFSNSSGSPQTCYGYFATDTGGTKLLWAANFDSGDFTKASGSGWTIVPFVGTHSNYAS